MIGKAYWAIFKYYDKIQVSNYPKLSLKTTSYIRTHKQSVVNVGELADENADFRNEYSNAYIEVIALVEEFQKQLIEKAF